jgi:hypothetical protein
VAAANRAHHKTVQRQAWVPENEYPVKRNAGYNIPPQRANPPGNGNQGRGNQQRQDR